MDLGTIIIGVIIIAICTLPFVYMHYNRVKKENKTLQTLKELAKQHNCEISQHEFCGDFVLGIDKIRNFVFFLKQKDDGAMAQFVDLAEVQMCQTLKKIRTIQAEYETVTVIERIELSFFPNQKNQSETKLELYDDHITIRQSGELQFADQWSKEINECLKK